MRHESRTRLAPPSSPFALHRAMRGFRLAKDERGSSLVEYAVIFMIFITMLLGIADFSRALYAYHFVSSQAREATRYAIVRGCSPTSPECPSQAKASDIQTFVQNAPLGIDGSKVTAPNITWKLPNGTTDPNHKRGSTVSVEVDYPFTFIFPFVSKSTLNMKSTSQMVISQ
jgi:Flp pilus assembly protein TadG